VTIAEKIAVLREKRAEAFHGMSAILEEVRRAKAANLTAAQSSRYEALEEECTRAAEELRTIEDDPASRVVDRDVRMLPGGELVTGRTAARSPMSLRYHERLADRGERSGQNASFGKWLKGTIMGDWRGADEERAMSIGTPSAGGYLVPTPLALGIIDLARNQSRILEAGAQLDFGRLRGVRRTGRVGPSTTLCWRRRRCPPYRPPCYNSWSRSRHCSPAGSGTMRWSWSPAPSSRRGNARCARPYARWG